jgi:hypothetical protein
LVVVVVFLLLRRARGDVTTPTTIAGLARGDDDSVSLCVMPG